MMRKPHLDRHLRIIGMPRRGSAKCSEGPPTMRLAHEDRNLRIIGVPRRGRRHARGPCALLACMLFPPKPSAT